MKIKLNKLSLGFILSGVSLIMLVLGFIFYLLTFAAFSYQSSKEIIIFFIIAIWGSLYLMVDSLLIKYKNPLVDIFYLTNTFAILLAFTYLLIPCLSPIGVYFTVNMGDMETYALGVPRCITGCVFFFISAVLNIVSSFFKVNKEVKHEEE